MFRALIIIIFIFNICLPFQDVASSQESMAAEKSPSSQEIVQYAKSYRKDGTLPAETEKLRQNNILEQAFASLPKYNQYHSLESAVSGFLADNFPLNQYVVVNASFTNLSGKSSDPVFLVKDIAGNLCYVVKAFKNPRTLTSKFLPEISALDFIRQLLMTGVRPIDPIAFAGYSKGIEEWGLLLETAAKGQRIDQFIYQLAAFPPDSNERIACFEVCQKVFQRIAESFAQLHAKKSATAVSLPDKEVAGYDHKISNILKSPFILEQVEKRIPLNEFLGYLEAIKSDALNTPLFTSYWHGDAHLGNMFYDPSEDTFYYIDIAKLHDSIGYNEEPLLDGTIDLVQVEENLRRIAIGVLSENEVSRLLSVFYESYTNHSSQTIPQPTLLFARTHKKLGRLVTYSRYINTREPAKRKYDQAVFEAALNYFENQVKASLEFQLKKS